MSEEAKPVCIHCERLARWTDNAQERLAQSVKEVNALRTAHEALLRRTQSLETALDQERADNERLRTFARMALEADQNKVWGPAHEAARHYDIAALLSGRGA